MRHRCRRELTRTTEIQQNPQAVRRGGSGVSGSLDFQWFGPIFSLQHPQASPSKQNPTLAGPMQLQVAPAKLRIFSVIPPKNPTLVHSQLHAPLDSDAINAAAQSSIHLLGGFFSVCRNLVALRRNLIRSIASRDPICKKSRKINGFYRISRRRDTIEPNGEKPT